MSIGDFIVNNLETFLNLTGVAQCQYENLLMIAVGALFIWLAIKHNFEPLLLVPIGMGIIIGTIALSVFMPLFQMSASMK